MSRCLVCEGQGPCPCCRVEQDEMLALTVEMTEGCASDANPGCKDYLIHLSDDSVHRAIRRGSHWETDGELFKTLRECKEYLCNNPALIDDNYPPEDESLGTWGCIDPCAILILSIRDGKIEMNREIQRTLDARGAMGIDGAVMDIDWAVREFKRVISKEVSVHEVRDQDVCGNSDTN